MNSIKNFLNTAAEIIIEIRRLQAESRVRSRYSNF